MKFLYMVEKGSGREWCF